MIPTLFLCLLVCSCVSVIRGQTEEEVSKLLACAGSTRYADNVMPEPGDRCSPSCNFPAAVCVTEFAGFDEKTFCDPLPEGCDFTTTGKPEDTTTPAPEETTLPTEETTPTTNTEEEQETTTTPELTTTPSTTTEPDTEPTTTTSTTTTEETTSTQSISVATTSSPTGPEVTTTTEVIMNTTSPPGILPPGVTETNVIAVSPPGFLPPGVTQEPGKDGGDSDGEGKDWHSWCCKWALNGQCDTKPVFTRPLCQKSCGTYGCKAETADTCNVKVSVDTAKCTVLRRQLNSPGVQGKIVTTERPRSKVVPKKRGCREISSKCASWAERGECETNPFWMKIKCQQSCNCCGCTYASIIGLRYKPECKDYNRLCPYWASLKHCDSNRNYMRAMCRAACHCC